MVSIALRFLIPHAPNHMMEPRAKDMRTRVVREIPSASLVPRNWSLGTNMRDDLKYIEVVPNMDDI